MDDLKLLSKKDAEFVYNKLGLYSQGQPWWCLTVKEQEYYQWLFAKDEYKKYL